MLIFTSGTSGDPKAVNVTQAKVAYPGQFLSERFGLGPDDVAYLSMPMFHSNAIMAGWGPALAAGATIALARRFSASGLPARRTPARRDVRQLRRQAADLHHGHARAARRRRQPAAAGVRQRGERPRHRRLRRGGSAASSSTPTRSTENAVIVQRVPDMPPGSLGRPLDGVKVLDPETMAEMPDAVFDADGRLLNAEAATGELVNTAGAGAFAGYYKDPDAEAERMRGGMYWSGDLAYRDADGFVYFAGRTADWLRVDGENLAAAPDRADPAAAPGGRRGGRVRRPGRVGRRPGDGGARASAARCRPRDLEAFLADQPDLSPKAWPRVRAGRSTRCPRTATNKVLKRELAAEGPVAGDGVLWTREPRGTSYTA